MQIILLSSVRCGMLKHRNLKKPFTAKLVYFAFDYRYSYVSSGQKIKKEKGKATVLGYTELVEGSIFDQQMRDR
jgi:hypothetical protein